jgi:hypothetical protein
MSQVAHKLAVNLASLLARAGQIELALSRFSPKPLQLMAKVTEDYFDGSARKAETYLVLSQEKMTGCRFTNIRFSKCFIEHLSINN